MTRRISLLALAVATVASSAGAAWAQTNELYLNSQAGDYVGQGQLSTYTTGTFGTNSVVGAVEVSFHTDAYEHWWYLDFAAPEGQPLSPGVYEGATRYPFQSPKHGGLSVSGDGSGCNKLTGRFLVIDATYDPSGNVVSFAADFEQHCEGSTPALYGAIRINSSLPITPRLAVGDGAVVEGPTGGEMTFTISLSQPSADVVSVNYATADGTALAGSDYVARAGSVSFEPLETSKPITISIRNDHAAEGDQYFLVDLSSGGVAIADGEGKGTIVDGEGPQSFLVLDSQPGDYIGLGLKQKLTVVDGDFTAGLLYGPALNVHFDGDTWWDTDFAAPGGAILTPGVYENATRLPFQAPSVPGLDVSGDGRGCNTLAGRFVVLDATYDASGNPLSFAAEFEQHCEGSQAPALNGAIWFNSTAKTAPMSSGGGQYQFSAPSYVAGESSGVARVRVQRLDGNASLGTVDYSTVDGTASSAPGADQDYKETAGTLTFAGRQRIATVRVPIVRDALDETNESFVLKLSNPQPILEGAELGPRDTALVTIADDDRGGSLQFSAASYRVSAATSAAAARLTVKRSGGVAGGVTVHYATSDGTATAGADYAAASGDLTFSSAGAGARMQALTIPVSQNGAGAKSFKVTLTAPTGGATLATIESATVTILGAEPTVGFGGAAFSARTSQASALVTVRRGPPLAGVVAVHYATSPGTAGNNGADYDDVSGDLTFRQGVSATRFRVPVTRDAYVDDPKTVILTLSSPTWSLGTAVLDPTLVTSTLTIVNPNVTPSVDFSARTYMVNEASRKALITVERSGDTAGTLTVAYEATGGTAINGDPAVDPDTDFTLAPGTLTFGPGAARAGFQIAVVDDLADEGTETVALQLSNPSWTGGPAVVAGDGMATLNITDNEPTIQFSAASYNVGEAARSVTVTVERTGRVKAAATVGYSVTGGTAVPDTGAGGDYLAIAPETLHFLPGQAAKAIVIQLEPDTFVDGRRTIELTLTGPTGAPLGTPATAVVAVKDDDVGGSAQFALGASSVAESAGEARIIVTRSRGAASEATVHFATLDGDPGTTAVAGTDYASISGTLVFAAGQKNATISVPVFDDGVSDGGVVSVVVGLDGPGGGLSLGSPAVSTLWIVRE